MEGDELPPGVSVNTNVVLEVLPANNAIDQPLPLNHPDRSSSSSKVTPSKNGHAQEGGQPASSSPSIPTKRAKTYVSLIIRFASFMAACIIFFFL